MENVSSNKIMNMTVCTSKCLIYHIVLDFCDMTATRQEMSHVKMTYASSGQSSANLTGYARAKRKKKKLKGISQ